MSRRFKNTLLAEAGTANSTEYQYGMAQPIDGDEHHFLFSNFGTCDNWETKRYEDVESYQSLDPARCQTDGKFYLYFKFKFRQ